MISCMPASAKPRAFTHSSLVCGGVVRLCRITGADGRGGTGYRLARPFANEKQELNTQCRRNLFWHLLPSPGLQPAATTPVNRPCSGLAPARLDRPLSAVIRSSVRRSARVATSSSAKLTRIAAAADAALELHATAPLAPFRAQAAFSIGAPAAWSAGAGLGE